MSRWAVALIAFGLGFSYALALGSQLTTETTSEWLTVWGWGALWFTVIKWWTA